MNGNDGDFEDDMVGGDGWNLLDEIDEDLESAELTIRHTKKKGFKHWNKIAHAYLLLEETMKDDDLNEKEKKEVKAQAKEKYPSLIKCGEKYSSIFSWMEGRSLALDDWYNSLPVVEKERLDTPEKIKASFGKTEIN